MIESVYVIERFIPGEGWIRFPYEFGNVHDAHEKFGQLMLKYPDVALQILRLKIESELIFRDVMAIDRLLVKLLQKTNLGVNHEN